MLRREEFIYEIYNSPVLLLRREEFIYEIYNSPVLLLRREEFIYEKKMRKWLFSRMSFLKCQS